MRCMLLLWIWGCAPTDEVVDTAGPAVADREVVVGDPYVDAVVSFQAGDSAGFGQEDLPGIVFGPPLGRGENAGSLDVVSLGRGGEIVLELADPPMVDGEGPDLIVFENAFVGFVEPAEVSVSTDGETWHTWPCATESPFEGCAGLAPVLANANLNQLDPTDPEAAGGDLFDLQDLGLSTASYVRIRDVEAGEYLGATGGFDLDALAVVSH